MKLTQYLIKVLASTSLLALPACETVVDQYGQQKRVMSPTGAAILNTAVATGVGAASGSLLKNQPGWMNGMISSLSGSVASQLVNSLANQGSQVNQVNQVNQINRQQGYQRYYQNSPYPNNYQPQPLPPQRPVTYQTYGSYQTNPNNGQYQGNQEVLYTRLPNGQFVPVNP